jgi:hypothetical protein
MSQRSTRNLGGTALLALGTIAIFGLMLVPGSSLAIVGPLAIGGTLAMAVGTLLLGVDGSEDDRVA